MDEKLKSEKMQNVDQFSEREWGWDGGEGNLRERLYAGHIFIQIYFRMHQFVAKFSNFSSPQAASVR